ncbi:2-iminobutanoate/2-iminopropanoate deaminase [Paraconexibacter sp. AEG42_29]|uniref:2-iminobutanoate/2-iminopropanoate deaminase n=1 Tax=Paraconexibacter sp. AEG42_29 TaxID=2997339 RepID=A0AAU7AZQ4_9ACTN
MSDQRRPVTALGAPSAVGPYSHGIVSGGFLFCSGQVPLDPETNKLIEGTIGDRTRRCLDNLTAVCAAAGAQLGDAVRLTVYTTDMGQFAAINEAYAAYFPADPPARVAIGVAALPLGTDVEIDAVIALPAG